MRRSDSGRLLNVLCNFSLPPVSGGCYPENGKLPQYLSHSSSCELEDGLEVLKLEKFMGINLQRMQREEILIYEWYAF